ncbi:MAG TPA: transcriptional regulator, partial [Streptomyces sp.]|nr:transcriptional regulator [Streptomyces sp.]
MTAIGAPEDRLREDRLCEDRLLAALANGTRREVLRLLRVEGPRPVQRLADRFDMRR